MNKKAVQYPLEILSTGVFMPGAPISSETLERENGIPPGWAKRYSGVEYRHWATDETGAELAAKALQNALEKAGLSYGDLDLIVSASAAYDHPIPHNACLIQEILSDGTTPVPGFDIDATCLGMLTAFDVCSRLLDGKRFKRIAIVSSEICSRSLNPKDWETFTLLGDAAVAILLGYPDDTSRGVIHADMKTYPHAARYNIVPAGGTSCPGSTYPADISAFYFRMEGIKLLRLAMESIKPFSDAFFAASGFQMRDVQHFIPHQASLSGLLMAQKALGIAPEQLSIHLPRYGNTLSCSIGLSLHHRLESGLVQPGDHLLLMGTGAGFSIGAVLVRV